MEYVAVAFTVICIYLAGRNNIHTWWTGIVACIAYGLVFYDAKLYADMVLQGFFIGTGILGWVMWHRQDRTTEKPITMVSTPVMISVVVIGALVTFAYSEALRQMTDAAAPFWDSSILVSSIAGQILLMKRKLENWLVWIVVNAISVPLYMSRELYLSAALYSVFLVHAVYAFTKWHDAYRRQTV